MKTGKSADGSAGGRGKKKTKAERKAEGHEKPCGKIATGFRPDDRKTRTQLAKQAERRAGEMLAEMPKDKGGGDVRNPEHRSRRVTGERLDDLNITKMQSHRWQSVAIEGEPFLLSGDMAGHIIGVCPDTARKRLGLLGLLGVLRLVDPGGTSHTVGWTASRYRYVGEP